jgi:hypothetical protein
MADNLVPFLNLNPVPAFTTIDPRSQMTQAMLLLESQLGTTLSWAGTDGIPCVAALQRDGKRLDLGGFKLYADVQIKVRVAAFPSGAGLPQVEHLIKYSAGPGVPAVELLVQSIDRFWDVAMMLHCVHPAQGA